MVAKNRARTDRRNHDSSNGLSDVRHEIIGLRDTVTSDAQEIMDGGVRVARSAASAAKGMARRAMSTGRERAQAASGAIEHAIEGNPYRSMLIAAATGAALTGLFFLSRRR
jgi:ElaB/YqjD/DUF883 family membrane-anchored ribosome-binding protein